MKTLEDRIAYYCRCRRMLGRLMTAGWYSTALRDRLVGKCFALELEIMCSTGWRFDRVNALPYARTSS